MVYTPVKKQSQLRLSNLSLNNPLPIPRRVPKLDHLEPSRLQQSLPVSPGALHTVAEHHHLPVPRGREHGALAVSQDELLDDELAIALFHDGCQVLQDLAAVAVAPVVEDEFEVVCAGICMVHACMHVR